jgi:hypothetical protein
MKILLRILMIMAAAMVVFNLFHLDWEDPLSGQSAVAAIGVLASLCALMLLLVLTISKKISKKLKH